MAAFDGSGDVGANSSNTKAWFEVSTGGRGGVFRCNAGCILWFEAQAQRGIPRSARLPPGLIPVQASRYFLTPGRRIVGCRPSTGKTRFRLDVQTCLSIYAGFRFRAWRSCGILPGRAAADLTTKRTRHESDLKRMSKAGGRRITAKTTPESKPSTCFASQGTAMLSSPRLLPL